MKQPTNTIYSVYDLFYNHILWLFVLDFHFQPVILEPSFQASDCFCGEVLSWLRYFPKITVCNAEWPKSFLSNTTCHLLNTTLMKNQNSLRPLRQKGLWLHRSLKRPMAMPFPVFVRTNCEHSPNDGAGVIVDRPALGPFLLSLCIWKKKESFYHGPIRHWYY